MKRLLLSAILGMSLTMVGPVLAKNKNTGLAWDDPNTMTDLTHFNVYVCDQPIADVILDEFGGAEEVVNCEGNLQVVEVPYKTGAVNADITYNVTTAKGTIYYRVDVQRSNGVRSALSNEVPVEYDYEAPRPVTVRVRIK